ncbi:MAG: glycosyltransferase family 9 protein [Parachlamydiales bacterium]
MKTAAVLPALGIGDAILMMIASHRLYLSGFQVTTFHDSLPELASWFPDQSFEKNPSDEELINRLNPFDLIIAENDNSPRIKKLIAAFRGQSSERLSIFYPTYSQAKHGIKHRMDKVFDPDRPMAENIGEAIANLLNKGDPSKNNGITPPLPLKHRGHPHRIIIHPTSRVPSKNWSSHKFLNLAKQLKDRGYDPHFCVSPAERPQWENALQFGCSLPHFSNLSELAAFIFESGFHIGNDSLLGHLASNLNIPTLIIADDEKRMRLWRPGWQSGEVVLPPQWIPNPRIFRWKKNHWQRLISVRKVFKKFNKLNKI